MREVKSKNSKFICQGGLIVRYYFSRVGSIRRSSGILILMVQQVCPAFFDFRIFTFEFRPKSAKYTAVHKWKLFLFYYSYFVA